MDGKNKKVMRRFIDEAWNKKNPDIVDELLATGFRHFMPGSGKPLIGPEAYKQLLDTFNKAFPKNRIDIEEVFGEGKRVCVRWTFLGTHKGEFRGIQPLGAKVKLGGVAVAKVRKGRIEEVVSVFDTAALNTMLTTQPAPPTTKPKSKSKPKSAAATAAQPQ